MAWLVCPCRYWRSVSPSLFLYWFTLSVTLCLCGSMLRFTLFLNKVITIILLIKLHSDHQYEFQPTGDPINFDSHYWVTSPIDVCCFISPQWRFLFFPLHSHYLSLWKNCLCCCWHFDLPFSLINIGVPQISVFFSLTLPLVIFPAVLYLQLCTFLCRWLHLAFFTSYHIGPSAAIFTILTLFISALRGLGFCLFSLKQSYPENHLLEGSLLWAQYSVFIV